MIVHAPPSRCHGCRNALVVVVLPDPTVPVRTGRVGLPDLARDRMARGVRGAVDFDVALELGLGVAVVDVTVVPVELVARGVDVVDDTAGGGGVGAPAEPFCPADVAPPVRLPTASVTPAVRARKARSIGTSTARWPAAGGGDSPSNHRTHCRAASFQFRAMLPPHRR
jgi:hypothetical protein